MSEQRAIQALLEDTIKVRNVGSPMAPDPYPATASEVAEEIASFIIELGATGIAGPLVTNVHKLLQRWEDTEFWRMSDE